MEINLLFSLAILIISIVVHELSHGYTAYFLGDPTAKYAGRLTINPIKHMELFGSVIVPLITALVPGGIVFGWAKPVPYNPNNIRSGRWGEATVAFAGPLSNFIIALVFSLVIRSGVVAPTSPAILLLILIVTTNITLAVFNLIPIPPLDGARIFTNLLPYRYRYIADNLGRYSFIYVLIFVFFLWQFLEPIIPWLFQVFTGVSLY